MKRKTFKINQNTLFIYKQSNVRLSNEPTEPTTNMTMTTTTTSGILTTVLGTLGGMEK